MNPFTLRRFLLVITVLLLLAAAQAHPGSCSVLKGTIYSWETLEPLPKSILSINTTPEQKFVLEDGKYMINLSEGYYLLKAFYYENGEILLYSEENISIKEDGVYTVDLILFPPLSDIEVGIPTDIDLDLSLNNSTPEEDGQNQISSYYFLLILPFFLILIIFWRLKTGSVKDDLPEPVSKPNEKFKEDEKLTDKQLQKDVDKSEVRKSETFKDLAEKEMPPSPAKIPDDLKEVIEILKSKGGRATQKELRKKTGYSEAKMSLIITDLERRGFVEKVKKGRGNIIFLKDE